MSLWNKTDTQVGRPKFLSVGQLHSITLTAPGSGYATAPTVTITAPGGNGVQATATATVAGGLVTGVTITNPGAGYATPPTIGFTGGGGTAATATSTVNGIDYDHTEIFFVSLEEAQVQGNKERGITGPGWWNIKTYTDANSVVRWKTECLVAISVDSEIADTGDAADDTTVHDYDVVYTLQPVSSTVAVASPIAFTAETDPAVGVTYQWENYNPLTGEWDNLVNGGEYSGATTDTLTVTPADVGLSGELYRLVTTTTNGTAAPAVSNTVILTVTV